MGGAASKDFIEGQTPKTDVAKELDLLGGYNRPALARNQSFGARLDWLGNQVGKAGDQIEAALAKDETSGRKELEKEAKRRQLMATRRGQGDIQLNLQFVDFYLKQKQFERPVSRANLEAPSILRNAVHLGETGSPSEPLSPRTDASRRSAERLRTLEKLYSGKGGAGGSPVGSFTSQSAGSFTGKSGGSLTAGGGAGGGNSSSGGSGGAASRWRQTVAHAKKTAFLTVGTLNALQGKRTRGPARIDNFALYAEQHLGDGLHKFAEETARLAAAREKLPGLKGELEELRALMRQLAADQAAAEAAGGADEDEDEELEAIQEDDGMGADEAAALASAAAANVRGPRSSLNGKPTWHMVAKSDGFGAPPPISSLPKPKPFKPRVSDGPSASGHSVTSSAGSIISGPSMTGTPLPSVGGGGVAAARGRRVSTGSSQLLNSSLNGPLSSFTQPQTSGHSLLNSSLNGPLSGLLGNGPGVPQLGLAGPGLGRSAALPRASWSGSSSEPLTSSNVPLPGSGGDSARASNSSAPSSLGSPLRPTRPGVSRLGPGAQGGPTPAPRSQSEPTSIVGAAAASALAASRPASARRGALLSARGPGPGRNNLRVSIGEPSQEPEASASPRTLQDRSAGIGEYKIGSMSKLLAASKTPAARKATAKAQLRHILEMETTNVLRQKELIAAIEETTTIVNSASGLLNMYCNRANGRWVELQGWALPSVHEMVNPSVKRMAERYRELVMKDLKEGRLGVMIQVDDDVLQSQRLGPIPLWSADPWAVLALTHPARTEATGHLVGLGMGVRLLLGLATAVEGLAGPEAVAKLPLVIACHDGQVDKVVADLAARKLCRFNPDKVVIIVQQRAPGHTFDRTKRTFVPAPDAPLKPAGSGYALLALGWSGNESFRLGGDSLTERRPLDRSPIDQFAESHVEWLSTMRLRDLVNYSPEHCLNVEQLAMSYALADSVDANMTMQVELVDGLGPASRHGSGIVLAHKERGKAQPPSAMAVAANVPLLRRAEAAQSPAGVYSAPASMATSAANSPNGPPNGTNHPASILALNTSPGVSASGAQEPSPGGPRLPVPPFSDGGPHPPSSPRTNRTPPRPHPNPGSPSLGSSAGALSRKGQGVPSVAKAKPGGIGTDGGPLPMIDIKWNDVQTPALASGMQQLLDAAAAASGGAPPRVAVAIKRYTYHLPSLKALLTGPAIYRPCLSVGEGGYLYVTFDASDVTAQPGARCAAISYTPRPASADAPPGSSPPSPGPSSSSGLPLVSLPSPTPAVPPRKSVSGGPAAPTSPQPRKSMSGGGVNPLNPNSNTGAIGATAAASAAAALQRGRLLTNDTDLDTLVWVVSDQDASPTFRASVSHTNTAKSRVTAHAPGGIAAATGPAAGPAAARGAKPQQAVIVCAVVDDPACLLAVRTAMAIMRPGAVALHLLSIAKDSSAAAMAAARALTDRFETLASATLGDVQSVVTPRKVSIVEDIVAYCESVRAVLVVTGSMSLAAPQGSSVVGSVALSLARECSRPLLIVKPNARLAEGAYEVGRKPCLRALIGAEPSSRPLVRYLVGQVLDGSRGDKLVLVRGKAFDKEMQELTSSRRILDHLADEATSNRRFDASLVVRRAVPGSFDAEAGRVADADGCHIVGLQLPEGRGPLPNMAINMLRASRSAVLLFRSFNNRPPPPVVDADKDGEEGGKDGKGK
ncbi:hypothetical protein HYH03_006487 [Edaphochlamys debaryana]|uniref:UspA domain-containing protein n=1 Tax=Edaphochlamys debaryana TaxID=47281 RepID=A0A835YDH2_9CHLO|nr:hypothetical protein HYH03_006487 [Edaphochlamys debaryana]|eukprot:KAG2495544.1 hypothetical protein HYH03_006487 [Edaphochlamys debaryana]